MAKLPVGEAAAPAVEVGPVQSELMDTPPSGVKPEPEPEVEHELEPKELESPTGAAGGPLVQRKSKLAYVGEACELAAGNGNLLAIPPIFPPKNPTK